MKRQVLLWLLISLPLGAQEFLSQAEIDTTIQRAYYRFIAADRRAGGSSTSQKEAIQQARQAAQRLREKAETDPNARYILWRVNELEAQIALEQEEYNTVNAYRRGVEINEIVDEFNKELDAERPSFAKLYGLHASMLSLDTRHANELADLVNHHQRYIRQKTTQSINDAFGRGDYDTAKELYEYAVSNRRYLGISPGLYDQWSRRITQRRTAQFLRDELDERLRKVEEQVAANQHITHSRRTIQIFSADLENASERLDRSFTNRYQRRLEEMAAEIDRVEDSLVSHGISLIRPGDTQEAARFMENTLSQAGISNSKLAMVDRKILQASQRHMDDETAKSVARQLEGLNGAAPTGGLISTGDIQGRLHSRRDSVEQRFAMIEAKAIQHYRRENRRKMRRFDREHRRLTRNQARAEDRLAAITELLDRGRFRRARRRYDRHRDDLFAYGDARSLFIVRMRINEYFETHDDPDIARIQALQEEQSDSAHAAKAAEVIGKIYTNVENRNFMDALKIYYTNTDLLREHAHDEAFSAMRVYLLRRYNNEYSLYDG
ncbi:hypothetical protein [Chitinivibrio alkaliphilus]|uniref:Uncharacterized protein n=1 Tax=Chitinivibrio alkaliphilus ACht1 TaxID=1313304 RepID=U7D6K0_9BACT|nr:hypothetical protein [Chitinivibrio alkaliphilus]ERP31563.1 hypothetical protein CALK_1426 [Chitinivibrio alkaliphilus ACht1]